jgi:dTDP-4-dehydrorhamnose 3,5-epimerase
MKIKATRLEIPDVIALEHQPFTDHRGYFTEVWQRDEFRHVGLNEEFVQLNESRSAQNVIRALHFQWDPPMGKVMRVAEGAAFLVAVDLRHNSPTLGKWVGETLTADSIRQIWAPAGFARGICALAPNTRVQYLCTAFWNAKTDSDIRWDDPEVGIKWPIANPVLSDRDRNAPTLREWLARPEAKTFSV